MKKFLIFIGIIAVIAIALMATTPDKQQHHDTIKEVLSRAVNAELRNNNIDGAVASIGSVFAMNAVDEFLNRSLLIRDHRFYNIGVIDYDGEFQMVSVGVFNHVYTFDENQARELIKTKIKDLIHL
jgi:hypothetical protein